MFMGIVGQVLSLDDGRHQNPPGLHGFDNQSLAARYWLLDSALPSVQSHDCDYPTMRWSDDQLERDLQFEFDFDFVDEPEHIQSARMPAVVESLICAFLGNDERECVVGDLNERYSEWYKGFGKRKADLYVYREVCRSLFPFIKRALRKTRVRILLDEWVRKLTN